MTHRICGVGGGRQCVVHVDVRNKHKTHLTHHFTFYRVNLLKYAKKKRRNTHIF